MLEIGTQFTMRETVPFQTATGRTLSKFLENFVYRVTENNQLFATDLVEKGKAVTGSASIGKTIPAFASGKAIVK